MREYFMFYRTTVKVDGVVLEGSLFFNAQNDDDKTVLQMVNDAKLFISKSIGIEPDKIMPIRVNRL